MQVHVARRLQRDVPSPVGRREFRREARHQQIEVRARFRNRLAPLQAAAHEHPAVGAALEPVAAGRRRNRVVHADRLGFERRVDGHPQLGRQYGDHAGEARRRDPDDREPAAADANRPADDVGSGPEIAPPVAIRHHRHARRADHVVLRTDRAADRRRDAERAEVVAGDDLAEREPRTAVEVDRGEHRRVADEIFEDAVLPFQVEIIGVRRSAELDGAGGIAGKDVDQPLGLRHRQRLEDQGVGNREERGVEADADRQRHDRHQRKTGTFSQPAQREPNIGNQ